MRVSVIGCSGSGKTTFGKALAARLGVPFVELDSIFHQPGWTELPDDEFRARVRAAIAGDGWVIDGNYAVVRKRIEYEARFRDPQYDHIDVARFHTPREATAWLQTI